MSVFRWLRRGQMLPLFFCLVSLVACGGTPYAASPASTATVQTSVVPVIPAAPAIPADPLTGYTLTGDVQPIHDPSIIRQGSTYYLFTTDIVGLPAGNYLPIRCSKNEVDWKPCGNVFSQIPDWVQAKVPGIVGLWAPDISYFNGLYHLYYAGSTLNSQRSVIGLATNKTLDPASPDYKWVDKGEVLESSPGVNCDFNAIDPNILVLPDGSVLMSYGSYWSGIKQSQIDPVTGMLAGGTRTDLATRPTVVNNPIEGASIVHHGSYYYLFVSIDYCCNYDITTDNYKEAVGRSTFPYGPFYDKDGVSMMSGGGTILLSSNSIWNAAGGATAYVDPQTGESLLVFHALKMTENGLLYGWVKHIAWQDDWPAIY